MEAPGGEVGGRGGGGVVGFMVSECAECTMQNSADSNRGVEGVLLTSKKESSCRGIKGVILAQKLAAKGNKENGPRLRVRWLLAAT